MEPLEELLPIAEKLQKLYQSQEAVDIINKIDAIEKVVNYIARTFSGSWLGYHSCVYYENFEIPPPEAIFSPEWGLMDTYLSSYGTIGDWVQFDSNCVKQHIKNISDVHDIKGIESSFLPMCKQFDSYKSEIESILSIYNEQYNDNVISKLLEDVNKLIIPTKSELARQAWPKGAAISRDMTAISQGIILPPHLDILFEVLPIKISFNAFGYAYDITIKAISHIDRLSKSNVKKGRIGTKIFIGHGQSKIWKELKDFISERLELPWDEFNRVSVAGYTNTFRLSEMLDSACFAFLIMTAEDEMADGNFHARMNVIHEAGLFQGRLGFSRAIILLEEGCSEFSNIQGLVQIRFPKGNIAASFEDIRQVLEREHVIDN